MTGQGPAPDAARLRDHFANGLGIADLQAACKKAAAANDAPRLRVALEVLQKRRQQLSPLAMINAEISVWAEAAAAGHVDCLDVLWDIYGEKRLTSQMLKSAWHMAVTKTNMQSIAWLEDARRPQPNAEQRAKLAATALARDAGLDLAMQLVADARTLQDAAKRDRLLVDFLRHCALHDRADIAREILQAHFLHPPRHFSAHNDIYQHIVMPAAVQGNIAVLQALLEDGHIFISDAQVTQVMVAALDKEQPAAAHIMLAYGADPTGHGGAALRYAAQQLLVAEGKDDNRRAAARDMMRALLQAGGDAETAKRAIDHAMDGKRIPLQLLIDDMDADARKAHLARLKAAGGLRASPASSQGLRESVLHQAARYRVLADLMREDCGLALGGGDWSFCNAGGQRVVDVLVASGHVHDLMAADLWRGRFALLSELLALVPESAMTEAEKISRQRQVQQALLAEKARDNGRKFKL